MKIYSVILKKEKNNAILEEKFYLDKKIAIEKYNDLIKYCVEGFPIVLGYYKENVKSIEELKKLKSYNDIHYYKYNNLN